MTATSARVSAGSAGCSLVANAADGPVAVPGEVGCCFWGPGSALAKSADEGCAWPMTSTSSSTGSSAGTSAGKVAVSAALSETYHSPGAGNLSSL